MILTTPSNVTFVAPTTSIQVQTVSFDLVNHIVTIVYSPQSGGGPGANKVVQHAIPGALQTAIETHVQASIEANEGFGAGTSTIQTP